MRLFIAINFDEKTKENILAVQGRLKEKGRGRFTTPENLHLTLAFLGEVEEAAVPEIKGILDGLNVPEMRLSFSRVGCFRGESELWWIGIKDNPALTRLQKELADAIGSAGIWMDRKKFKPHITLAREMRIGRVDQAELLPREFWTDVSSVSLMLSHRVDGKLTYTELYRKGRN